MANDYSALVNDLGPVIQKTLRNRGWLFRAANTDFGEEAREQGDTINAVFAKSLTAVNIAASPSGTNGEQITPTKVALELNKWKEAAFYLSHKDMREISQLPRFLSAQVAEGVEAVVGSMEQTFYQEAVSGSSTEISGSGDLVSLASNLSVFTTGLENFSTAKAPSTGRTFIVAGAVAANLRANTSLQKINESGDPGLLREGELGRIMGVDVIESQYVETPFSGSTNVMLQRDGLGIAVRPGNSGAGTTQIIDPESGIGLTLTITEQEYQTKWSISALWGVKTIKGDFNQIFYGG